MAFQAATASKPRQAYLFLKTAPLVPMLIIFVFVFTALFADFLAPHSPVESSLPNKLIVPFWMDGGSWAHPLGTDALGRDTLSRVIHGARVSLAAGLLAITLSAAIGTSLGLISGYFGGALDSLIMRVTDAAMAFPMILLALLLAVVLGPSFTNLIIVIVIVLWSRFARLIRGEVLSWRERDFIALAKVAGCSPWRIIGRHLLPNVLDPVVVMATLQLGWVILIEASLSFLGAGIPPPTPAWGSMVAEGRQFIGSAWWLCMFPGAAIMVVVLAFNLFGNWLRDYLDPRLRQTRGI